MRLNTGFGRSIRAALAGAIVLLAGAQVPRTALAATAMPFAARAVSRSASAPTAPSLVQVSTDPYTNSISQHKTEVEPDNASYGSTIVDAFQVGRTSGGGSANIGFATSTNSGATWLYGYLPHTTTVVGGSLSRISDPAVAYDAKHKVWLISSLPINAAINGIGVTVSRSTDGGLTWGDLVYVAHQNNGTDKEWIACDNTATSPYYGHCYVEWDNTGTGQLLQMSTSTDGGLTWGAPRTSANRATVIGGQPLVQPNGTVIVPIDDANGNNVLSFTSSDGGATWSSTVNVAHIMNRFDPANIRSGPLPTARMDGSGKVYVIWEDCRFESGCSANDLVMSTSTDGTTWSPVTRIPIGGTGSGADYFLPGLGVDATTAGSSAHLGLVYYYYPNVACSVSTCQLDVGFVSSTDGGASWSAPVQLAGPMNVQWLANAGGYMVGDYMSTAIAGGKAYPIFAVAGPPKGGQLHEAMFTVAGGLPVAAGTQASRSISTQASRSISLPAMPSPAVRAGQAARGRLGAW